MKKIADFTFDAYNLAEAVLAISYCLENAQKFQLTEANEKVLEKTKEWIQGIFTSLQLSKIAYTEPYDLTKWMEIFNETSQENLSFITQQVSAIENYLNQEADKLGDNKLFNDFFIALINCCLSVEACINRLQKNFKESLVLESNFLEIADSFGAISLPIVQSMDALCGLEADGKKDLTLQGICYGMVSDWAEQIQKTGTYNFNTSCHLKIYEKQKTQLQHKKTTPYEWGSLLDFFDTFTLGIVPLQDDRKIYRITWCNQSESHSMGLRRIPHTNEIEFIDPNHGIFLFSEDQQFTDWLAIHLFIYRMEGVDFTDGQSRVLGIQPENAKSCLPCSSLRRVTHFETDELLIKKLIKVLNTLEDEALTNPNCKIKSKRLAEIFLNILPRLISYIKSPTEVENIKNVLPSCIPIFGKQPSKQTHFQANPWEKDEKTKELLKKLAMRNDKLLQKTNSIIPKF